MATGTLTPSPYQTVLDANGNPVSGAKINTYIAGTSTPVATYTDVGLTVANANPIVADSSGRYVAFLSPGGSYKYVITDALGAAIRTIDNITAVPTASASLDVTGTAGETLTAGLAVYLSDGSGGKTAGQWFKADSANGYSSSTAIAVGMTPAAIASGATGSIRVAGTETGLSSLTVGTTYYAGAAGALTATAPVNARVIGVADTTSSLVLQTAPPPPAIPGTSTVTTTGTITVQALPTGVGDLLIYMNNATLATIQGIAAGLSGQKLTIISIGAGQVDLAHQNAGATAANRLINVATSGNTSLAAGSGSATYQYDATTARWRLVQHEQGAWITPTYAGASYTASSGTWTVDSGDVSTQAYYLRGRSLTVAWILGATSASATPTNLIIGNGAWGGFTVAKAILNTVLYNDNGAGNVVGFAQVSAAGTSIPINKLTGTFSIATNTTNVLGEITFEVN